MAVKLFHGPQILEIIMTPYRIYNSFNNNTESRNWNILFRTEPLKSTNVFADLEDGFCLATPVSVRFVGADMAVYT